MAVSWKEFFICLSCAVAIETSLTEVARAVEVHVAIRSQIISNRFQVVLSFREAGGNRGNTHGRKRYMGDAEGSEGHKSAWTHRAHKRGQGDTVAALNIAMCSWQFIARSP